MIRSTDAAALEAAQDAQRYADYRPTGFDAPGLGKYSTMHDRQDWRVFPAIITRDSGALEASNFATAQAELHRIDPDQDHHETHRFGHWACGWYALLIFDAAHEPTAIAAGEMIASLADYPVLDEHDLSAREYADYIAAWPAYAAKEFADTLITHFDLSEPAAWLVKYDADADDLRALYDRTGKDFESHDHGPTIFYADAAARLTRQDIAAFLRRIRNANRQNRPTATRVHCPACGITYEQTGAVPVVCGACGACL